MRQNELIRLRQWCFTKVKWPGDHTDGDIAKAIGRARLVEEYLCSPPPLDMDEKSGGFAGGCDGDKTLVNNVTGGLENLQNMGATDHETRPVKFSFSFGNRHGDLPDEPLAGKVFVGHKDSSPVSGVEADRVEDTGDGVMSSPGIAAGPDDFDAALAQRDCEKVEIVTGQSGVSGFTHGIRPPTLADALNTHAMVTRLFANARQLNAKIKALRRGAKTGAADSNSWQKGRPRG